MNNEFTLLDLMWINMIVEDAAVAERAAFGVNNKRLTDLQSKVSEVLKARCDEADRAYKELRNECSPKGCEEYEVKSDTKRKVIAGPKSREERFIRFLP